MPQAATPHDFKRRILVVVSGMSPQVVTETLYALAVAGKPAWRPTEVHVITTTTGARLVRERLLNRKQGHFHALCREYALRGIAFGDDNLHVVEDAGGRPLDDITTPAENEAIADHLTELIRDFAADEMAAIHLSLAGGRKTMSYYAGYALSLFARVQDRLSHVLVSPQYESNPDFFFPSRAPRLIAAREGTELDCQKAKVVLAEIPFVRLRDGLDDKLLHGSARFSQVVRAAQRSIERPRVEFLTGAKPLLTLAGQPVKLPDATLTHYLMLLQARCKNVMLNRVHDGELLWSLHCEASLQMARDQFQREDLQARHQAELAKAQLNGKRPEWTIEEFDYRISRLNKGLSKALGPALGKVYQMKKTGKRGAHDYGLFGLAPEDIHIRD